MASVKDQDEAECLSQESQESSVGSGTELLKEEKEKEVSVKNSEPYNELYYEKILFVVLSVFNILSVILLIIMGIQLLGFKSSSPKPVAELCFPRVAIEGHPYDRNIAYYNETHYCYQNLSSIWPIIGNLTSRWLKEKFASDTTRTYKWYKCEEESEIVGTAVKVHKTVKLMGRKKRSIESLDNVAWECQSGEDEAITGSDLFKINEDCSYIEIKKDGLYYVYSQVNVQYDTGANNGSNLYETFFHCVIKRTNIRRENTETFLMRDSNSMNANEQQSHIFSSFLGSNFILYKGDNVAVRIHDKNIIDMDPKANFLGIYILS